MLWQFHTSMLRVKHFPVFLSSLTKTSVLSDLAWLANSLASVEWLVCVLVIKCWHNHFPLAAFYGLPIRWICLFKSQDFRKCAEYKNYFLSYKKVFIFSSPADTNLNLQSLFVKKQNCNLPVTRQSSSVEGQSHTAQPPPLPTPTCSYVHVLNGKAAAAAACLPHYQNHQRELITGNCPLPFACFTQMAHWLNRILPKTLSFHSSEGHFLRGRERKARVKRARKSVPGESFWERHFSTAVIRERKSVGWWRSLHTQIYIFKCVSVFVLNTCSQDHRKMCMEKNWDRKKSDHSNLQQDVWL